MSKLTNDEVLKLARLARLQLSNEELNKYRDEISSILEYVEQLSNVDTTNLEPTDQVTGLVNVFRKDEVKEYTATPNRLLEIAPEKSGRYIKVKRMI